MTLKTKATLEDLYQADSKAELVHGEIVFMSPTGDDPSRAAAKIFISLFEYEKRTKRGRAYPDNTGFVVRLPNRQSFSPDASFYTGRRTRMKFLEGAPVFAAEVRSEGDYGPAEEVAMAAKRADYFAAGTQVVWDVDLLSEDVVRVYRSTDPTKPTVYRRGQIAEAEPAVPGWRMAVDELFPE